MAFAAAGLLAACGGGGETTTPATTTTSAHAGMGAGGGEASRPTVWLCRPGAAEDPCEADLDATSIGPTGTKKRVRAAPAAEPPVDCFYVYPTVSGESGLNSNLAIQPAEVEVAAQQASRFSQLCRVWAPMYRQVTAAGLQQLTRLVGGEKTAYASVLSAWREYLVHDNDGRPIVFIGHSQGASMLIDLLREQVDDNPALRARTVSAILLGGNVQVPDGRAVGGTFQHLPLCGSAGQTGCVIAYSSFAKRPPEDSLFGRPGTGVSLLSGQASAAGERVACVNPADLDSPSTAAPLAPYLARFSHGDRRAEWVTYPKLYTAACRSGGGATWLQVDYVGKPGDARPRLEEDQGPLWGLHTDDVNLALGNLVADVRRQEKAYEAGR